MIHTSTGEVMARQPLVSRCRAGVASERCDMDIDLPAWAQSTTHSTPRLFANAAISATGMRRPVDEMTSQGLITFVACVSAAAKRRTISCGSQIMRSAER